LLKIRVIVVKQFLAYPDIYFISNIFSFTSAGAKKALHEEALSIAGELKKEGLSKEFIAKTTKLSIQEIEEL
jgi:hypothetical protein